MQGRVAQSAACAAMAVASACVMVAAAMLEADRRHKNPRRSTGSKTGVLRRRKHMRNAMALVPSRKDTSRSSVTMLPGRRLARFVRSSAAAFLCATDASGRIRAAGMAAPDRSHGHQEAGSDAARNTSPAER
jgi:hypothetical protein